MPLLGPDEMRIRVAEARVARLATVDPDGRPHLVPIVFALDDRVIYTAVDRKPKRTTRLQRLRNVEANPFACVLVDHYADDWDELWWVRVRGPAQVAEGEGERQRAVELLSAKYRQHREEPPVGPVLALTCEEWVGWSATAT